MNISQVHAQTPKSSRRVLILLSVLILLVVILWQPITRVANDVAGTTSIASTVNKLSVNTAGVCGEWHVRPHLSLGLNKDDVNISALDALSSGDVWIVGEVYGPRDWDDKQSVDMLSIQLDGSTSRVHTIPAKLGYSFPTVKMLSTDNVWATGPESTEGGLPQLAHWDGANWQVVQVPLPQPAITGKPKYIHTLAALAPNDMWASGNLHIASPSNQSQRESIVLHWNGVEWKHMVVPQVKDLGRMLAVNANDLWIDGSDSMVHWNGSVWSKISRPEGIIWDMAASASDDVWAVGDTGDEAKRHIITLHWDGKSWSTVPTPSIPVPAEFLSAFRFQLRGITALAKDDAWAVGFLLGDTPDFYQQRTIVLHWDGKSWSSIPGPNFAESQSFSDIVATSPNELWAVGQVGPDIDEKNVLVAEFQREECEGK